MNWYNHILKNAMPVYDVYHGTSTPQSINDEGFSYLYLGKGNDQYGPGFYFTDSETVASSYSGNLETSVNIRAKVTLNKPIKIEGKSAGSPDNGIFGPQSPRLLKKQVRNLVSRAIQVMGKEFLSNWGDVSFEGERVVINNVINSLSNASIMTVMSDLFGNNSMEGLKAIRDIAGYDGIVVDFGDYKFIIAWFPEQIEIQKPQPKPSSEQIINEVKDELV